MHGWHERIGRDIRGPNGYEPVDDPVHTAATFTEEGTGKWSAAKEITNARVGKGSWMQQDRYSVEGALMILDEYFVDEVHDRPGDRPLLLAVSLSCPHYPYQCPEDLFNYYMRSVEPYVEDLPSNFDCHEFFKVKIGEDVTYREAHRATAAYYGMIEWVDMQYTRVISKLEEMNVLDDFVVVFLSDHGEMLGQKGLWEKQQYFEASVRVPFSISWPQRFPRGCDIVQQNVSLVDLFPTLCEIANVPIPDGLDGRTLVPLMEGRADGWRNEVYSELYHPFNGPSAMVKRDFLKYFRFEGKGWPDQLFDLAVDPGENRNLIDDAAYADDLAELRAKLNAFLK
jgi:choline-sulfatase